MKTYETVSHSHMTPQADDRISPPVAPCRAGRTMRLSRRHALLLGAGLWVGLFGLELIVLPPWDGHAPRRPIPTALHPSGQPVCPPPHRACR